MKEILEIILTMAGICTLLVLFNDCILKNNYLKLEDIPYGIDIANLIVSMMPILILLGNTYRKPFLIKVGLGMGIFIILSFSIISVKSTKNVKFYIKQILITISVSIVYLFPSIFGGVIETIVCTLGLCLLTFCDSDGKDKGLFNFMIVNYLSLILGYMGLGIIKNYEYTIVIGFLMTVSIIAYSLYVNTKVDVEVEKGSLILPVIFLIIQVSILAGIMTKIILLALIILFLINIIMYAKSREDNCNSICIVFGCLGFIAMINMVIFAGIFLIAWIGIGIGIFIKKYL